MPFFPFFKVGILERVVHTILHFLISNSLIHSILVSSTQATEIALRASIHTLQSLAYWSLLYLADIISFTGFHDLIFWFSSYLSYQFVSIFGSSSCEFSLTVPQSLFFSSHIFLFVWDYCNSLLLLSSLFMAQ